MALRFFRASGIRPSASLSKPFKYANGARFLATVEGNPPRQIPALQPKATPISHETATFTIRVCETYPHLFAKPILI